jgi:hypothetical protein
VLEQMLYFAQACKEAFTLSGKSSKEARAGSSPSIVEGIVG